MLHHLKIPDALAERILARRGWVLACFALLTAISLAVACCTPLHVSLLQALMPDRAQYQAYFDRASELGGGVDDLVYAPRWKVTIC